MESKTALVVEKAYSMLGWAYSQAKRFEQNYTDCSSLVYRAVIAGNPSLASTFPKTTSGYPSPAMQEVSKSDLRAGDVMYKPGHVALYIGDDKYINASDSGVEVKSFSLGGKWATKFYRPNY